MSEFTVLVVDDYSTMRRILVNQLREIGIKKTVEAADGDEAYDKLLNNSIHLIISDWNMEPVSGLDFLKKVRANPKTAHTPFIMVTAEARPENVVIAKKAGVDNYIVKPFNADTLKKKIVSLSALKSAAA